MTGTALWHISGDAGALKDIAVDFLDGVDPSLDALNARGARVLVRAAEIVITFPALHDEDWIVQAFTRRHPDVTVTVTWTPHQDPQRSRESSSSGDKPIER